MPAELPQDETRQIAHVKDDLIREFAALGPAVVDEQVAQAVRGFTQAPVRSFIPVLVRREARDRLRSLSRP
ncbi:MAG: three-helix bundle dimerization domain-containing protein [Mycobacteriales bacterium]